MTSSSGATLVFGAGLLEHVSHSEGYFFKNGSVRYLFFFHDFVGLPQVLILGRLTAVLLRLSSFFRFQVLC